MAFPEPTDILAQVTSAVPFVGPEAIERQLGQPLLLRLGANESSFGPSPRAQEAMRQALGHIAWYGDPENFALREAVAQHHGVARDNVLIASGIDELLGLVVRAYLPHGATAVASLGGYPIFPFHVTGYGGQLERVPYRNDHNDLAALAAAAQAQGAKIVYLANPDNPSGSWYEAGDLQAFRAALPPTTLLILDQAYYEFAPTTATLPLDVTDPRIVWLRTFSKAYGMAGARVGYLLGTASMVAHLDKIRLHFGINRVAQEGALAALADGDYLASVVAAVAAGREDYYALATELGLRAIPSATNFVTIDVGSATSARELLAHLAERRVFLRMPWAAPLDSAIRVTVGTPEQRAAFAAVLREVAQA